MQKTAKVSFRERERVWGGGGGGEPHGLITWPDPCNGRQKYEMIVTIT